MDIKTVVIFETKKNDRVYQFVVQAGAPLGECYDAAYETLTEIMEQAKKATDAAKKDEVKEEVKPELVS